MLLNEKIKLFRKENNLTQQELANKLNMNRTAITEIERGKVKGTTKFISALAEISNLPITYWLDSEVDRNYKSYEALDVLIDALIKSGMIKEDALINQQCSELINAILEKEIAFKIKKSKE